MLHTPLHIIINFNLLQCSMSDKFTMADMAAMMKQLMDQISTIARRDDLQAIQSDVTEIKSNVVQVNTRVDSIGTRLVELERRVEESEKRTPRMSTSSSRSTDSEAAGANEAWRPRLTHIRGRAPWGTGPEKKINRHEAVQLQNIIGNKMDIARRDTTR